MRIKIADSFDPDRQFQSDIRERVFQAVCLRLNAAVWSDSADAPNAVMDALTPDPKPLRIVPVDGDEHDTVAIQSSVFERLAELNGAVIVSPFDEDREAMQEPVVSEAVETVDTVDPVRYDSVEAAADPVDEHPPEPDEAVYLIQPSDIVR